MMPTVAAIPRWAVVLVLALLAAMNAQAARLALVIGNRDYVVGALRNPLNDAEDMARALEQDLGFRVTLVRNLKRDDIGRAVDGFTRRIRQGDDVLVFYAGHGLQVKGVNYLPAVDARIQGESDVALNSLNLNDLLQRLDEAGAGVRLVLVDACRDNPYSRSFRSSARGLARVADAPAGTLMHFATRPGGVADDGPGRNGLYTTELLKHLRTPGLPVELMLKRVSSGVRQASGGNQQPWAEGSLDGEFYLGGGTLAVASAVKPGARDASETAGDRMPGTAQPAPRLFRDCSLCPEMVQVPAGSFVMGSPAGEPGRSPDEGPQRRVDIRRAFALSRTEVTQAQWQAVMGSNPSGFQECGADCPVENVSWHEAQEFVRRLSQQTRQTYRLPTEAEWEYAVRASSSGPGRATSSREANVASSSTVQTGSFAANALGLHDMLGNVWEWVEDCYGGYADAPNDGSAHRAAGCTSRVLRGGSWNLPEDKVRVAFRYMYTPDYHFKDAGFRVARNIP